MCNTLMMLIRVWWRLFGAMGSRLISGFGIGFRGLSGGELPMLLVKRAPLWTYPNKSVPAEKAQRKKALRHPGQTKLTVMEVTL